MIEATKATMQKRHTDREAYFHELARTCEKYFMPYIARHRRIDNHTRVLEIGCGDGGNLLPLSKAGCSTVGVDIAECRIEDARRFFHEENACGEFIASDVFELKELHHSFDLIICHDVIEHIGDKRRFISLLHLFLADGGIVFMSFPAWQMPFGGHQQICRSMVVSHLPFIHLLPNALYRSLLKMAGEDCAGIDELMSIKETRTPIELFERLTRETGTLRIADRTLWLINPHYETKFGLRPRPLPLWMARIPYFRNFFTTSCFYILMKADDARQD